MRLIPVLDIRNGEAVAGKSGKRAGYKPLVTIFASSSDPAEIAEKIPLRDLYVADLNGIMEGSPDFRLLKELSLLKKLMVDAGVRNYTDVEKISGLNVDVIIGTETLGSTGTLQKALERFKERIIVSIDIKNDKVISSYLPENPTETFNYLRALGARRFIFLDISSVGTLRGFRFDFLKGLKIGTVGSDIEILVGGGIVQGDLARLEKLGASGALVGTALHRGLIKL